MNTLIFYCYCETEQTKRNLQYFVDCGLYENTTCFYVFIINNNTCSVNIPNYSNVCILKRVENCLDLPTYKFAIDHLEQNRLIKLEDFKYYYFINSSCIGPFIPCWCENKWYEILNNKLNVYSLIGPIIEIPPDSSGLSYLGIHTGKNIPFIHSYMFGVNKDGFNIIKNLMPGANVSREENVYVIERILTSALLVKGLKVSSLLTKYKNIDWNNELNWNRHLWTHSGATCHEIPGNYDGIDVNPYEIIFVKNIRNSNATRTESHSGISDVLKKTLDKYIMWK